MNVVEKSKICDSASSFWNETTIITHDVATNLHQIIQIEKDVHVRWIEVGIQMQKRDSAAVAKHAVMKFCQAFIEETRDQLNLRDLSKFTVEAIHLQWTILKIQKNDRTISNMSTYTHTHTYKLNIIIYGIMWVYLKLSNPKYSAVTHFHPTDRRSWNSAQQYLHLWGDSERILELVELVEHEINKFHSERRISDKLWQTGNIFHSFNFTKFLTSKYVGFKIA